MSAQTLNEYGEESKTRPRAAEAAPRPTTQRNSLFKKRASIGPSKARGVSKSVGGGQPLDLIFSAGSKDDVGEQMKSPRSREDEVEGKESKEKDKDKATESDAVGV